jgi:hypothetical protein
MTTELTRPLLGIYVASYYPDPEGSSHICKLFVMYYEIHISVCEARSKLPVTCCLYQAPVRQLEGLADNSGRTICTVGFNCLGPLNSTTQVSSIAEIQRCSSM